MQLAIVPTTDCSIDALGLVGSERSGRVARIFGIAAMTLALAACASSGGKGGPVQNIPVVDDPAPYVSGTMRPYTIRGRTYRPVEQPNYDETGMASWYGQYHQGRPTSSGERFDMNALTAAHKTLPLPSMVEVTNTANGRRVLLRVNDRGPFADGRIIDLSRGAAEALGLLERGVGEVRVRYAGRAPRNGGGSVMSDGNARASSRSSASRSSTERPYTQVVREAAQQPQTRQPVTSRSSVPIPQQPLPPAMPVRDVPVTSVPPSVTTSEPLGEASVSTVPKFRVQVIAFDERAFADGIARRLGGDATVESFERNGRTLYRVVTGSFSQQSDAERARQAIIARGFAEALLIGD